MKKTSAHMIVTTTCDTPAVCKAITDNLLKANLAACIQVSDVDSHYRWEGKVTHDNEFLLTIKTRKSLLPKVEETIRAHHSYKVPQIVSWPLSAGSLSYLKWIDEVTAQ